MKFILYLHLSNLKYILICVCDSLSLLWCCFANFLSCANVIKDNMRSPSTQYWPPWRCRCQASDDYATVPYVDDYAGDIALQHISNSRTRDVQSLDSEKQWLGHVYEVLLTSDSRFTKILMTLYWFCSYAQRSQVKAYSKYSMKRLNLWVWEWAYDCCDCHLYAQQKKSIQMRWMNQRCGQTLCYRVSSCCDGFPRMCRQTVIWIWLGENVLPVKYLYS